ncbi:MAG: DNA (cytosine-5-)-methyltransferase [Patescibacteria group bacterium]
MIPNHFTAKLSELDLEMVKWVPPGGSWKNIPVSVPSSRLKQIRKGFEEGKGSRSTYYGRLSPAMPSYTISTYFNRPGNGCFIHYDFEQHRLISQREAARLQTFPDDFIFVGSKLSINKQIGNAVPPVLGYQIAKSLGKPGIVVDLFTGAGGLSLGFHWAGWKSVIANDIDPVFLETYKKNVGGETIAGDIRKKEIFKLIVEKALAAKKKYPKLPLVVIGGPPCQGFSTAGNQRSMTDERNHLFKNYKKILDAIKPDAFIFENVAGLMNMEGGSVFKLITKTLGKAVDELRVWKLQAEQYGVPQRRTRVVIIGHNSNRPIKDLVPTTLKTPISCEAALSDLPSLVSAEDGSLKDYVSSPVNQFQRLMRCEINVEEYLKSISP